ncbi:MAG: RNB domain-containing ribonuclease [Gemmatimonadaceae bacterium]
MNLATKSIDLHAAAERALNERGFEATLPLDAVRQLAQIAGAPAFSPDGSIRDLRALLWSSIDNSETRDLDQIEVASRLSADRTRILVAIADVDAVVHLGSPLDQHAALNTTSVYTGVATFPMLPERLSTDVTSLGEGVDRLAIVIEFEVGRDGGMSPGPIYRAWVRNHAQLAYDSAGAWLAGDGPAPPAVARTPALADQLKLQNETASRLRTQRFRHGALDLETIEASPLMSEGQVVGLTVTRKSPARDLIEDFMIAANSTTAHTLAEAGRAVIRRVVSAPERWPRIVELANTYGTVLPAAADGGALAEFLVARRTADPDHFADLSLAVVKLLGPGQYVVQRPGGAAVGHFGLAVDDYAHSTAPNRRYADLVTQRLVKAMIDDAPPPYSDDNLGAIAVRCTAKADDARAVERRVRKQVAAELLATHIGESFDAIVTGVTPKGTFARLTAPPAEGIVLHARDRIDVGDKVRVRVVAANPEKGYIDFELA